MEHVDIISLLQERSELFKGHSKILYALTDLLVRDGVDYFKAIPFITTSDVEKLAELTDKLLSAREEFHSHVLMLIDRSKQKTKEP